MHNKGDVKITNENFIVNWVAYVNGLKQNLISLSHLVVGTGNQALFDDKESVISNKVTNEVLLKSKRKCDMCMLDVKPIVGLP